MSTAPASSRRRPPSACAPSSGAVLLRPRGARRAPGPVQGGRFAHRIPSPRAQPPRRVLARVRHADATAAGGHWDGRPHGIPFCSSAVGAYNVGFTVLEPAGTPWAHAARAHRRCDTAMQCPYWRSRSVWPCRARAVLAKRSDRPVLPRACPRRWNGPIFRRIRPQPCLGPARRTGCGEHLSRRSATGCCSVAALLGPGPPLPCLSSTPRPARGKTFPMRLLTGTLCVALCPCGEHAWFGRDR